MQKILSSIVAIVMLISIMPFVSAQNEAASVHIVQVRTLACTTGDRNEPIYVFAVRPTDLMLVHGLGVTFKWDNTKFDMVGASTSTWSATVAATDITVDSNGQMSSGRNNAFQPARSMYPYNCANMSIANANIKTSGIYTEATVAVFSMDGANFPAGQDLSAFLFLLRPKAGVTEDDFNSSSIVFDIDYADAISNWGASRDHILVMSSGGEYEDPDTLDMITVDAYQFGKDISNPTAPWFPIAPTITYTNSTVPPYSGALNSPVDPADLAHGYTISNEIGYTFTNTGDAITDAAIVLGNPDDFEVSPATIDAAEGGTADFTVKLKAGKEVGEYTTTVDVKVDGESILSVADSVTQKVIKANRSDLSGLSASGIILTPIFSKDTIHYTANVDYSTRNTMITATPEHDLATVEINGVKSTAEEVPLAVGKNTITVVVTAEDSLTTKTYTIVINRAYGSGGGGVTFITYYTIQASASEGGKITPESAKVAKNAAAEFKITPNEGYRINDVLVNGKSVGPVASYKFENVISNVTIHAVFEKIGDTKGQFIDVNSNDWFYNAIMFVSKNEFMIGIRPDRFSPNSKITRGMLVTILYRMEKEPTIGISSFSDVSGDEYYGKAVAWAKENGIVNGRSKTKFAPNAFITREQMIVILYRYANLKGYNTSKIADLDNFADKNLISDFAKDAVSWAVGTELISGKNSNMIDSQGSITRAEIATTIQRFNELIAKQTI